MYKLYIYIPIYIYINQYINTLIHNFKNQKDLEIATEDLKATVAYKCNSCNSLRMYICMLDCVKLR